MLFLFGRFMQPMRIVLGAAMLGIGIVIHQPLCVVAGASLRCLRPIQTGRRWRVAATGPVADGASVADSGRGQDGVRRCFDQTK